MIVSGECNFISIKTGEKNGKQWCMAKFLDEDADEFFTAFITPELCGELQGVPKKNPVILTLNLVPGQKYFSVECIEIIKM